MMEHLPPRRTLVRLLHLIRIRVHDSKTVMSFSGSEERGLRRYFDRVETVMSRGQKTRALFGFKPVPAANQENQP